jgi:hypothetical protein
MIGSVDIANMALSHIGGGTIASFTEASTAARQCNLWYATARKHILEMGNWSFARKRAILAEHGDDPSDDWGFRYRLPSDCIIPREIQNTGLISVFTLDDPTRMDHTDAVPYEIEVSDDTTLSLLTNMEDAVLIYTADQTSPELYSSAFVLAFSHMLASYIAYAMTGNIDVKDFEYKLAVAAMRTAGAIDGNQSVPQKPREAEHIRARY